MTARQPEDRRKGGRAERLAAALKENLKRRKVQARGRSASDRPPSPPDEASARPKSDESE
jgi:hypothetical protein